MRGSKTVMATALSTELHRRILEIRGHKVLLDNTLAELYGVETKALNRAVRRNTDRFPADFMFQLNAHESEILRGQIGTSKGSGGRRYLPYAFTEQGIAMLSGVLQSERAVRVNVEIMRAFVRLRHWSLTYDQLTRRLDAMEGRYDGHFKKVFQALRQILKEEAKAKPRIGFK